MEEKKNFIVSESALKVLMEAVQLSHSGVTLQVLMSFLHNEISEPNTGKAKEDVE